MNDKQQQTPTDFPLVEPQSGCGCDATSCCSPATTEPITELVTGTTSITTVDTTLSFRDRLGGWKARWGLGRMRYTVAPGLYAVGEPAAQSPVLVSANYKLSFDALRSQLAGRSLWILVLDTRGINVWCAAGKGTFGTDELIARLTAVGLGDVVSHRKLIVPQLGATGVAAHEVERRSGFRVVFGPVLASDLPAYLDNGQRSTPAMRQVRFPLRDRLVLIPVELVMAAKYWLLATVLLVLLSGFGSDGYAFERIRITGLSSAVFLTGALFSGAVLMPVLLPWLPGRAFAVKGIWAGLPFIVATGWFATIQPQILPNWAMIAAWSLAFPAVTSFLGMNFTGSTTYTSLSGVLKEMRIAVPLQIGFAAAGLGLWVTGLFI